MIEKKDDFCVDSDNGNRWACNFFTQEKEILETCYRLLGKLVTKLAL